MLQRRVNASSSRSRTMGSAMSCTRHPCSVAKPPSAAVTIASDTGRSTEPSCTHTRPSSGTSSNAASSHSSWREKSSGSRSPARRLPACTMCFRPRLARASAWISLQVRSEPVTMPCSRSRYRSVLSQYSLMSSCCRVLRSGAMPGWPVISTMRTSELPSCSRTARTSCRPASSVSITTSSRIAEMPGLAAITSRASLDDDAVSSRSGLSLKRKSDSAMRSDCWKPGSSSTLNTVKGELSGGWPPSTSSWRNSNILSSPDHALPLMPLPPRPGCPGPTRAAPA